jgi:hypothetical protein
MIFLHVFLSILHNIGLYIYIVRYISDIRIPGFLQNISKKKLKTNLKMFKLISLFKRQKKKIKIFCFHAYDQILKSFQAYFYKKTKNCIFLMF